MTQLAKLFSLSVSHAYSGGVWGAVDFVIPEETQEVFRRARLIGRVREGTLTVLFEAGGTGKLRLPSSKGPLRIGLRVKDPCFANVTEPPPPLFPAVWVYTNEPSTNKLEPPAAQRLTGALFRKDLETSARPVTVSVALDGIQPVDGRTRVTVSDEETRSVALDLSGLSPGLLGLVEEHGSERKSSQIYLHPELCRAAVLGVVEIHVTESFYSSAPSFDISFGARREKLLYYLLVKGNVRLSSLSIVDKGLPPKIEFEPVKEAPSEDSFAKLFASEETRVALCASVTGVARRSRPRKNIQLRCGDEVLIEHLPHPRADKGDAKLVLSVFKNEASIEPLSPEP